MVDSTFPAPKKNTNFFAGETDPILEEIEYEELDDTILSESNFYENWQRHKTLLLNDDKQKR